MLVEDAGAPERVHAIVRRVPFCPSPPLFLPPLRPLRCALLLCGECLSRTPALPSASTPSFGEFPFVRLSFFPCVLCVLCGALFFSVVNACRGRRRSRADRKSTRLNSSHVKIS